MNELVAPTHQRARSSPRIAPAHARDTPPRIAPAQARDTPRLAPTQWHHILRHNQEVMFRRFRAKAASRREQAKAADTTDATLADFAATRTGVQAWVEDATGFNKTSLLLVADTGEWLRCTVPSIEWARDFAERVPLTCFTAGIDAYPQRMRDWDAAHRRKKAPDD